MKKLELFDEFFKRSMFRPPEERDYHACDHLVDWSFDEGPLESLAKNLFELGAAGFGLLCLGVLFSWVLIPYGICWLFIRGLRLIDRRLKEKHGAHKSKRGGQMKQILKVMLFGMVIGVVLMLVGAILIFGMSWFVDWMAYLLQAQKYWVVFVMALAVAWFAGCIAANDIMKLRRKEG